MPAYKAAYKPAGLEAGKYKDPIRGRRQGGAPRGEGAPYLSCVKTPAGVDRGHHLTRLELEILEFFGFLNRDYFGAPPTAWSRGRR
jgi:hypothetical protein